MTQPSTYASGSAALAVPPAGQSDGVVAIVAGSLLLPLGAFPDVARADAVLLADVPAELSRLLPAGLAVTVPLARDHTTTTLVDLAAEIAPERFAIVRDMLRTMPGGDLSAGLAAYYALGAAAWLVAARADGLAARVTADLLTPVWRKRNAELRRIAINYQSSGAGGGGGPAAGPAAEFVASLAHDQIGCVVAVNGFLVGALSFLGLGDRIFHNTAMTAVEQVAYTLDPARHAKESRALVLTELPAADAAGRAIDRDRDLRSTLGVLLVGGWSSRAVQGKVLEVSSNREFLRPYGALAIARSAWFGLITREALGAAAARHYLSEWKALSTALNEEDAGLGEIVVDTQPAAGQLLPDAQRFIEQARQAGASKPPLFDDEVLATQTLTSRVMVGTTALDALIPPTPDIATPGRYRAFRRLLALLPATIERAGVDTRTHGAALRRHLPDARRTLLAAGNQLFGIGIRTKLESLIWGRGRHVRRFRRAFEDYHAVQRRLAASDKADGALKEALDKVSRASRLVDALDERARRTLEVLAGDEDRGNQLAVEGLRFTPLSDVYGDLFSTLTRGNVSGLRALLPGTAESMTLQGLAHLLGTEPHADGIFRRLRGRPDYQSPFWGGADSPRDPFLRFIVLPPLEPSALAALRDAAERTAASHTVVTGDTLAGGVSAMSLDLYDVDDLRTLFPEAYRTALRDITTTRRDLYPMSPRARALAESVLATHRHRAGGLE